MLIHSRHLFFLPTFGVVWGAVMVGGTSLSVAMAAGAMSPALALRGMQSGSAAQALAGLASAAGRENPIRGLRSPSSGCVRGASCQIVLEDKMPF